MTPRQRLEALLAGKKIRRYGWEVNEYVCFNGDDIYDEVGDAVTLPMLLDDDYIWEIYEEPKVKVKRYAYAYRNIRSGKYALADFFYKNDEEAKTATLSITVIRIDSLFIETDD